MIFRTASGELKLAIEHFKDFCPVELICQLSTRDLQTYFRFRTKNKKSLLAVIGDNLIQEIDLTGSAEREWELGQLYELPEPLCDGDYIRDFVVHHRNKFFTVLSQKGWLLEINFKGKLLTAKRLDQKIQRWLLLKQSKNGKWLTVIGCIQEQNFEINSPLMKEMGPKFSKNSPVLSKFSQSPFSRFKRESPKYFRSSANSLEKIVPEPSEYPLQLEVKSIEIDIEEINEPEKELLSQLSMEESKVKKNTILNLKKNKTKKISKEKSKKEKSNLKKKFPTDLIKKKNMNSENKFEIEKVDKNDTKVKKYTQEKKNSVSLSQKISRVTFKTPELEKELNPYKNSIMLQELEELEITPNNHTPSIPSIFSPFMRKSKETLGKGLELTPTPKSTIYKDLWEINKKKTNSKKNFTAFANTLPQNSPKLQKVQLREASRQIVIERHKIFERKEIKSRREFYKIEEEEKIAQPPLNLKKFKENPFIKFFFKRVEKPAHKPQPRISRHLPPQPSSQPSPKTYLNMPDLFRTKTRRINRSSTHELKTQPRKSVFERPQSPAIKRKNTRYRTKLYKGSHVFDSKLSKEIKAEDEVLSISSQNLEEIINYAFLFKQKRKTGWELKDSQEAFRSKHKGDEICYANFSHYLDRDEEFPLLTIISKITGSFMSFFIGKDNSFKRSLMPFETISKYRVDTCVKVVKFEGYKFLMVTRLGYLLIIRKKIGSES